jgi:hypothetical protein
MFGGLQLVIVLDPNQLPPVADPHCDDPGEYCFQSALWPEVCEKYLHVKSNLHLLVFANTNVLQCYS